MANAHNLILLRVYLREIRINKNKPEYPVDKIINCVITSRNMIMDWEYDEGDKETYDVKTLAVRLLDNAILLLKTVTSKDYSSDQKEEAISIAENGITYFMDHIRRS